MTRNKTLLIAAAIGVLLAWLSLYTVSETEFALITQFGRPLQWVVVGVIFLMGGGGLRPAVVSLGRLVCEEANLSASARGLNASPYSTDLRFII